MMPIVKTKLRSKLLSYYFLHSGESCYVREIASLIAEDPGNLSRELRSMEKEGIFISRLKGRIKLYSLNKAYPLFGELKSIVFKTEGAEGKLKRLVLAYKDIDVAFIYGSFAKNSEKETSDIDLAVVGKFDRNKFTNELRSLESRLGREINFTSYTREEFDKKRREEGGFLSIVLAGKIILLKGGING